MTDILRVCVREKPAGPGREGSARRDYSFAKELRQSAAQPRPNWGYLLGCNSMSDERRITSSCAAPRVARSRSFRRAREREKRQRVHDYDKIAARGVQETTHPFGLLTDRGHFKNEQESARKLCDSSLVALWGKG